jgi:hypothetical protein
MPKMSTNNNLNSSTTAIKTNIKPERQARTLKGDTREKHVMYNLVNLERLSKGKLEKKS